MPKNILNAYYMTYLQILKTKIKKYKNQRHCNIHQIHEQKAAS